MSLSKELSYKFSRLSVMEKLIITNVAIFILNGLLVFLFKLRPNFFMQWFELPENFINFITQPWSLITYSFFHGGFFHIFWNMLILYFSGRIFLNLLNTKHFLNVYLLGVVSGGLLFILGYNLFPAFDAFDGRLIGASAGVMAILIFVCAYIPNQEVRVIFFNTKLWYIGAFWILFFLIQLPNDNPGGHLAHLGGAFLGFFYARKLREGKDIGKWLDWFRFGASKTSGKKKKSPLKTVYKNETTSHANKKMSKNKKHKDEYQHKIDHILDKISKSGYESLSKEEKDFLFNAGKESAIL